MASTREQIFKALLLEMGQKHCAEELPELIVGRLLEDDSLALARVWLMGPGDICDTCFLRKDCPDRSSCLHLVASGGRPRANVGADWSHLGGRFRRFPLGVRKVGQIGASGEPLEVGDIPADATWLADPAWAAAEGIRGFGGQPLVFQGEVLGVLAVFTREPLDASAFAWLRMIADHAAQALANARAFEQIESLREQLALENEYLRQEVGTGDAAMVGESPAMTSLAEQIRLVGPTDATALVTGESGTGKELVARSIHQLSARADGPLIKVNCASIPPQLYESEFFGHIAGSFTGAIKDRAGRFAAAHGGTLFLDEVGEIPLDLQGKLLRVLQERQYERIGEEVTRDVDVRIIAATNRDLTAEVEKGRFRSDLFYRLNVFPVHVAPLRERAGDVALLVKHFLARFARKMRKQAPRLTRANLAELTRYDWPGNIRELENVVERAVITARGGALRFDLPRVRRPQAPQIDAGSGDFVPEVVMRDRERANLLAALEQSGWKVSGEGGAAELLGLAPTTLAYRIRKFELRRDAGR